MKCRDRANRIIARERFKLIEKKEKELFWGTQTWQRPLIPFRDEPIYFKVLTGFLDNFTAFWAAKKPTSLPSSSLIQLPFTIRSSAATSWVFWRMELEISSAVSQVCDDGTNIRIREEISGIAVYSKLFQSVYIHQSIHTTASVIVLRYHDRQS